MAEISLIDYLAAKLGILRMELKNPAYQRQAMQELLNTPDQLFSVMEWSVAITYLLRDNYVFSSVEKAKQFIRNEFGLDADHGGQKSKLRLFLDHWGIPFVCGIATFLLMQYVFIFSFITSESMEPTIIEGSFIIGFRLAQNYRVGDIIIFEHEGSTLVKRIVAEENDTVYIDETSGRYELFSFQSATRQIEVPDTCYFVVGDNLENSYDSRYWNHPFVTRQAIIGIVIE